MDNTIINDNDISFLHSVVSHKEPICPQCGKGRIKCPQGKIDKPHYFCCTSCGWKMNIDYDIPVV